MLGREEKRQSLYWIQNSFTGELMWKKTCPGMQGPWLKIGEPAKSSQSRVILGYNLRGKLIRQRELMCKKPYTNVRDPWLEVGGPVKSS